MDLQAVVPAGAGSAWPSERGHIIFGPRVEDVYSSLSPQLHNFRAGIMHDVTDISAFMFVEYYTIVFIRQVTHATQRFVRLRALEQKASSVAFFREDF